MDRLRVPRASVAQAPAPTCRPVSAASALAQATVNDSMYTRVLVPTSIKLKQRCAQFYPRPARSFDHLVANVSFRILLLHVRPGVPRNGLEWPPPSTHPLPTLRPLLYAGSASPHRSSRSLPAFKASARAWLRDSFICYVRTFYWSRRRDKTARHVA